MQQMCSHYHNMSMLPCRSITRYAAKKHLVSISHKMRTITYCQVVTVAFHDAYFTGAKTQLKLHPPVTLVVFTIFFFFSHLYSPFRSTKSQNNSLAFSLDETAENRFFFTPNMSVIR